MGIVREDIDRVKDAVDFLQVVSEQVALKRVGRQHIGLCPFHSENTASFSVNLEQKVYYCFGCQARGDAIRFVQETQHLEFAPAVEWLAARYGIVLRYDEASEGRDRQRRNVLHDAMAGAVEWYHQRLLTAADGGAARGYLRSRGYDKEVVEKYRLGWAPDDWDALCRALDLPRDIAQDTGLGFLNRAGKLQDSFRARVLFPIFDASGKPVAFGGRVLPGAEGSKYKNSAESKLYAKSRTLYALNWAKDDIIRADEVIVCEGYTDVIAFFEAGLPRAVATCGTALADEHFRTLKNFAPRIVLAYDADAAGQNAAARFYEWEQRYEVDVAVAALPAGADPADLGRTDKEALRRSVAEARPFLGFRVDRILSSADLAQPEGRARAAEMALAAVAEHPSELVRDQYLMQIADACRMDAARLRERLTQPKVGGARIRPQAHTARTRARERGPEIEALRLLVHRRDEVLPRLVDALFDDDLHHAAFVALRDHPTLADAAGAAPPEAADLLYRIAVEEPTSSPDDVRVLIKGAADRALRRLQAQMRQRDDLSEYGPTMKWLDLTTEQLDDPDVGQDAEAQLVAWLVQFREEEG